MCDPIDICKKCDEGYYINAGKCTICTASLNCKTCVNGAACASCTTGLSIYPEGKCATCIDGYYIDEINCKKCSNNCTKCTSATNCI